MSFFRIQTQAEFNECLMWVSDLYKDVYGIRPRGYNFQEWTFQELQDFVNGLIEQNEIEAALEKAAEEKAIQDVMSLGVDRETALRWLDDADMYYMYGDDRLV